MSFSQKPRVWSMAIFYWMQYFFPSLRLPQSSAPIWKVFHQLQERAPRSIRSYLDTRALAVAQHEEFLDFLEAERNAATEWVEPSRKQAKGSMTSQKTSEKKTLQDYFIHHHLFAFASVNHLDFWNLVEFTFWNSLETCLRCERVHKGGNRRIMINIRQSVPVRHGLAIRKCLKMSQNTSFKMPQNTSKYFKISQNTSKCLKMSQNISKYLKKPQKASKCLKISQNISKNLKKPQKTSKNLKKLRRRLDFENR